MSYFRKGGMNFPISPDGLKRRRTIKDGEWHLETSPSDSGITFLAVNNEYKEWLWDVSKHSWLFNLLFGDFQTRLKRAKTKYQIWIDNKNSDYIFYDQISDII